MNPSPEKDDGMLASVVNVKHSEFDIYIGRDMPGYRSEGWGNRFVVGRDGTREEVIEKFRQWVLTQPDYIERVRKVMPGKRIVCWCKPKDCHGDIFLELLGQPVQPRTVIVQQSLF